MNKIDNTKSVPELVSEMLLEAALRNIELILIESTKQELSIKFYTNDTFIQYTGIPEDLNENIIRRIKIIAGLNIFNKAEGEKGIINFCFNNVKPELYVDFYVNYIPSKDVEKIEIKIVLK